MEFRKSMKELLLCAVCMLPLSALANDGGNKWVVSPATVTKGTTEVIIPVYLSNPVSITGVQFDIVLPKGMSIKTTGRTKAYDISMNDARYEELDHSLSAQLQTNGSIRVLCTSTTNTPIWDEDIDGDDIRASEPLINITFVVENEASGAYEIGFQNIALTHYDGTTLLYDLEDTYTDVYVKPSTGTDKSVSDGVVTIATACDAVVSKTEYQAFISTQSALTAVDLRAANISDEMTTDDIREGLETNTIVILPSNSMLTGENIVVNKICEKLVVDDNSNFDSPVSFLAKATEYERDLSGYGTICLPYTPSTDGNDFYEFSSAESGTLNFTKVEKPKANTPYLFKKIGSDSKVTASNVMIQTDDAGTSTCGTWTMHGTYGTEVFDADDNVYAVSDGKLYHNIGTLTMKPFRAYFTSNTSGTTMNINIDGTTVISTVENGELAIDGEAYNLAGQKVGKRYKGIVIINGRKEIRK